MKKNAYLILMFIFLNYNFGFAQFKKNNFVICPQLPYSGLHSTYSDDVHNYNINQNQYFRSTFQYFFNSRLAIGFLFDSFQKNYKANSNSNSQDKKENSFSFTPEIQFNLLNAKFTPYVKMKIGNLNYTKLVFDNPQSSKVYNVYTLSTFKAYENNKSRFLIPTFGLSYLIKKRIGLTCYYEPNSYEIPNTDFSTEKIFLGLQIVCN